ncbi:MAG: hypothetical protein MJA31_01965 [Clostridia bacterium]|nr:hypothetical protein [Clostridia bacterium]
MILAKDISVSEATEYRFEIVELNEEIINRFPVENFEFGDNITTLKVKTKSDTEAERVHNYLKDLCVLK